VVRNLIAVLGDQLDPQAAVFDNFDPAQDLVWMAEVHEESTKVWTHKARIVIFLTAMCHFASDLRARGIHVDYQQLSPGSLSNQLAGSVRKWKPQRIIVTQPGEWSVQEALRSAVPQIEFVEDRHFFCTQGEFQHWAAGKKQLRMEFFYRLMRERTGYLMEDREPAGGKWNYDAENRKTFGKSGPPQIPSAPTFPPDSITLEVIQLVEKHFPNHPGQLNAFDYPVTQTDARLALQHFVTHTLAHFGDFQDAMWTGETVLFHSRLSAVLNLKILNPREILDQAEQAYREGLVPLAAVEGFIRQILGWREYVRGIYWLLMPEYATRNHLDARASLPSFYWTGETDMVCLREAIGQTLRTGYAHHIQRLMVTGLFTLLLGVKPKDVHEWYLAVYVDAVEWVELPNTLGMSQYGDGGVMASKPYIASGKYIDRMSNYCSGCRYDPAQATGDAACPFTTLYWDFLQRHKKLLERNPRMSMQVKNLARLKPDAVERIQLQADGLRKKFST
jgi:deoxyribodipyrimidine photolyase-related protein